MKIRKDCLYVANCGAVLQPTGECDGDDAELIVIINKTNQEFNEWNFNKGSIYWYWSNGKMCGERSRPSSFGGHLVREIEP